MPLPRLRKDPEPGKRQAVTVRPIYSSAALQDWYREQLRILITKMADEVSQAVIAAYGEFEPPELAKDAPPQNPSLRLKYVLRKNGRLWTKRMERLSLDLGREFAKRSFGGTQRQMMAALKDAGFTVKFEPTPGSAAAYQAVIAEQVNLITSIPQQYLKDVESQVWTSVMAGSDMHTLATNLRKTYGVSIDRASLIARDQNNKAKAIIEQTRRQELGITHAIWQHSAGGRVPRRTHVAMNGKAYLISRGMWDEDEGAYVLPGQLINCRCTSRAIIPGFERESVSHNQQPRKGSKYIQAARARAR